MSKSWWYLHINVTSHLSLTSAKTAAEVAQWRKPQLCPAPVCRWQPFHIDRRLPLAFSSPINAGWSLCAARHINVCFVNVIHQSFHSNRNGNYCGCKDNYSSMAASSNSHTLMGLLLETGEVLGLPATSIYLMCSTSNVNVSVTGVSPAETTRLAMEWASYFWFVGS